MGIEPTTSCFYTSAPAPPLASKSIMKLNIYVDSFQRPVHEQTPGDIMTVTNTVSFKVGCGAGSDKK